MNPEVFKEVPLGSPIPTLNPLGQMRGHVLQVPVNRVVGVFGAAVAVNHQ